MWRVTMAAPLCKIQRSLCLHWDRLYDKIADAFFVRSFHINQQRLLNRKKNRTSKEANGFDKFLANSLMNSPSRKHKEKLSTPQESILDRHPNRLRKTLLYQNMSKTKIWAALLFIFFFILNSSFDSRAFFFFNFILCTMAHEKTFKIKFWT